MPDSTSGYFQACPDCGGALDIDGWLEHRLLFDREFNCVDSDSGDGRSEFAGDGRVMCQDCGWNGPVGVWLGMRETALFLLTREEMEMVWDNRNEERRKLGLPELGQPMPLVTLEESKRRL